MDADRPPISALDLATLPSAPRWRDALFAMMPVAAILLLVLLLGLLLWIVDRDERDRTRLTLISDALWVEQTLRFQLATDEDTVSRLALDVGRQADPVGVFLDRARLQVASNPEVAAIAWFDGAGRILAAVPDVPDAGVLPAAVPEVARRARFSARPLYGDLRRSDSGTLMVDLAMAVPAGASSGPGTQSAGGPGPGGAVVATISVSGLVARHVPWWIAEKYAVRLASHNGEILAEKARVEPFDPALSHAIAFDPPLRGTVLTIAPYRGGSNLANNALYAAIVGLAVLALASLALLQRHVARRRRVELRLGTETVFRRAMEDSLTVGMRARDPDGRILYVNPAFCRMVGFSAGELIGQAPPMPYWIPDELEETRARHDALIRGELKPKSWETRFRRRDGTIFDALIYEAPLVEEAGGIRGWMGSIIDITERKTAAEFARQQAESLQRSGRLVTLGEMASTLAHELNQPLAAIASYATGSLNLIKAGDADPELIRGALEKLSVQAQRAGQIIRRIQDFVRKREPRFGEIDLADVLAETVSFAVVDARKAGVRIEVAVDGPLQPVTADRILIEQVLLNLIRNAAEAMAASEGERLLTVSARLSGDQVVIEVADRGPGIDPNVSGRLFDAFVSTKSEGMGMGLNICRSIVELHRGRLAHQPRPGGGTVFVVALPTALKEAA